MNARSHVFLYAATLSWIALFCTNLTLQAQQPPEKENPKEPESVVREQTIYIPYEKLRTVFEKEGRGVFLPYAKYRELWDAAREKTTPPDEKRSPIGVLITEIENEATVAKDVVEVQAVIKIEVLNEGWHEVPLRLADAAVTEAVLDGEPARLLSGKNGYALLVEKKGNKPENLELKLKYAKTISRSPGQNSVSFQTPRVPVSRWKIRIPESGVKVNIDPLLAATEVTSDEATNKDKPNKDKPNKDKPNKDKPNKEKPNEEKSNKDKPNKEKPNEETVVLAFVGAAPQVRIDWTPKAEGATGLEALASVESQQEVHVAEGVTRTVTQLVYSISRAELSQLSIRVPADQKVVNVFDANVRQWSVEAANAEQTITVQLFEPAKGQQNVTVELEKFAEESDDAEIQVPVVEALNVGRQQGVLVVRVDSELRAETTGATGLMQVDATDLPDTLKRGSWAFSYRYAAVPFALGLSVEKVQPRILVDSLVEATLEPELLTVDLIAVYTIERAGVFRFDLEIPTGYEVRHVRGRNVQGAKPASVEGHHLEEDNPTRLIVNLRAKALGRVALGVTLERELREPDLLAPTDKKALVPLPLPYVVPESVEWSTGQMVLYAPESLRVNSGDPADLRRIGSKEALSGIVFPRDSIRYKGVRPIDAFAYTQQPGKLSLSAQRRKPQVAARQLLVMRVQDGSVRYEATFFFNVRYSSVKSLRVDLPAEVASEANKDTTGIQEGLIVPPPDDVEEGYVAWQFTSDVEFLGEHQVKLSWEEPIEEQFKSENRVLLHAPSLVPRGTEPPWGQIVLTKAETIDVQPNQPDGLRRIDHQHDLMPGANVPEAAVALEFHDDWKLEVVATRYQLDEIKRTSIERALLRMVVTRADSITVQALYRIRSARQRLVVKLPVDAKFDTEPRVNGHPVALEVGDSKDYHIPLIETPDDTSFLLELRYTQPAESGQFSMPEFTLKPAVQKVYLIAYLPEELTLLGTKGPWTDEFWWTLEDSLLWRARPNVTESGLLEWMSVEQDSLQKFPTDGRPWCFSALRPTTSSTLSLTAANQTRVRLAVIVSIGLLGLILLPASAKLRIFVLGLLVIGLIFCGVFAPIFARQILNGVFLLGLFLVAMIWLMWYLLRTRPRQKAAANAANAANATDATDSLFVKETPSSEAPPPAEDETSMDQDVEPPEKATPNDSPPKDETVEETTKDAVEPAEESASSPESPESTENDREKGGQNDE